MKKISILVVAPYPEFGELAVDIAKAFIIVGLVAIIITTCFPEYVMFFVNILS